jgi:hypothetical protein
MIVLKFNSSRNSSLSFLNTLNVLLYSRLCHLVLMSAKAVVVCAFRGVLHHGVSAELACAPWCVEGPFGGAPRSLGPVLRFRLCVCMRACVCQTLARGSRIYRGPAFEIFFLAVDVDFEFAFFDFDFDLDINVAFDL